MFELKVPGTAKSRFLTWGQLEQGYWDGSIQPAWVVRDLAGGQDTLVGTLMAAATRGVPAPAPGGAGPVPRPAVAPTARGPQRPTAQGQQPGVAGMPAAGILDQMPKGRDLRGTLTPYKVVAVDDLGDRVKEVAEASLADWLKTMPSPPPQVMVYRLEQDRVAIRVVQRRPDGLRMLVLCDVEWSRYQNGMQIVFRADWRYLAVWRVVRQLFWLPFRFPPQQGPFYHWKGFVAWGGLAIVCCMLIQMGYEDWTKTWIAIWSNVSTYVIRGGSGFLNDQEAVRLCTLALVFASCVAVMVIGLIDYWGKLTPDCEAKLERWMHNALEQQVLTLEKKKPSGFGLLGRVRILDLPHP